MGAPAQSDPPPSPASASPQLQQLVLPGAAIGVADVIDGLGLWHRPEPPPVRPRVMLNMVATADGRASLNGRSGPLSSSADRELFHALRTPVDAVLVGAGTVRTERYQRIIRDHASRRLRVQRGLPAEALACIVSRRLVLADDIPLLADPAARVVIVTQSDDSLPTHDGAPVHYVRARRSDGLLDLPAALTQLRERFDVRTLLCEGGPQLASQMFVAGLVDELFLSISPQLAGGLQDETLTPRILAGAELNPPTELTLLGVLHSESHLFLRYRVAR
jgi:riboflavin biosynthesis pyrimidine reductase